MEKEGYDVFVPDLDRIEDVDYNKAYNWMMLLAGGVAGIIALGFILTYPLKTYAVVFFSVIIVGIIVFFSVLRIANYLSGTKPLNSGEVRQAITASIVVVYLGLLPILIFSGSVGITSNGITESAITNFTYLVIAVVLFYFGSATATGIWGKL